MRLVSWNVNGIRAAIRKGFWDWLDADGPDMLCLQETRIQPDQLTDEMRNPLTITATGTAPRTKDTAVWPPFRRDEPRTVREGWDNPGSMSKAEC